MKLSLLAFNNFVSPNNDGINDVLVIENINLYKGNNLSIYNVHGQLVYNVVNYQNDWSGEVCHKEVLYTLLVKYG
jgi:gliding motility-associated-like protein